MMKTNRHETNRSSFCRRLAVALLAVCVLATAAAPARAQVDDPAERIAIARQRVQELLRDAQERIEAEGLDPSSPEAREIMAEAQTEVRRVLAEARNPGGANAADPVEPAVENAQPVAPANPGARPEAGAVNGGEFFEIDALAQPVSLTVLIDLIQKELDLPVLIMDPTVADAQVVIASDLRLPRRGLINFLQLMLDTQGFAMTFDEGTGLYLVQKSDITASFGASELTPTQFIDTGSIPPSSIQTLVDSVLRGGGAAGTPAAPGGASNIQYLEQLNLIVMTASPQRIANVRRLVSELQAQQNRRELMFFELEHVAPSVALDRLAALEGSSDAAGVRRSPTAAPAGSQAAAAQAALAAQRGASGTSGGSGLVSFASRLTVAPTGNALVMHGLPGERQQVERLLDVVDRVSELRGEFYKLGSRASSVISEVASGQGLGPVITASGDDQGSRSFGSSLNRTRSVNPLLGNTQQDMQLIGSGFILYPEAGGFEYRGTPAQHATLRRIIDENIDRVQDEDVVYEFYKLRHTESDDVAAIIQSLISGTQGSAESSLIPGSLSRRTNAQNNADVPTGDGSTPADPNAAIEPTDDVFVLSDPQNNQVVVKAPKRLQPQFERLINQLDLRRPQVYIEAQIVSVTNTDDFRLAIETQILAGQFGLQTNLFGLSEAGADFFSPRQPSTDLAGFTSALLKSQYLPFVINAIQENTDARIVSSPQILVDDNVEASIVSLDQQPTTTTTIGETSDQTTFAGFQDAGTTLTVTPSISEGGYLRLSYEIELSNFVGEGAGGVPGPRQERTVSSESVTIPSDATLVVGGIVTKDKSKTVLKVPLLGDIPLVGELFRSTVDNETEGRLYVFITPRILRDPNFVDLRLLTKGPLAAVGMDDDTPPPEPISIPIVASVAFPSRFDEQRREGGVRRDPDSPAIDLVDPIERHRLDSPPPPRSEPAADEPEQAPPEPEPEPEPEQPPRSGPGVVRPVTPSGG